MAGNPYRPPQAVVSDMQNKRGAKWGRSVWLHLFLFAWLSAIGAFFARYNPSAFDFYSIGIGVVLTILFSIGPLKAMMALSEKPGAWYWDVLYYLTVGGAVLALFSDNARLFVALSLPTYLLSGIFGFASLVIERAKDVRIYTSNRRWLFESDHT